MNPEQLRNVDFYSYILTFASLASGATASQSFAVDTDADFHLQKLCHVTDIAGAAVTSSSMPVPLATIQISDGGSSRQMFSQAAPLGAFFGNGFEPFILPAPRLISAGSSISVSLTNYSAATTYNIRLAFVGLKRYKFK